MKISKKQYGIVNPGKKDYLLAITMGIIALASIWLGVGTAIMGTYEISANALACIKNALGFCLTIDALGRISAVVCFVFYFGILLTTAMTFLALFQKKYNQLVNAITVLLATIMTSFIISFFANYVNAGGAYVNYGVFALLLALAISISAGLSICFQVYETIDDPSVTPAFFQKSQKKYKDKRENRFVLEKEDEKVYNLDQVPEGEIYNLESDQEEQTQEDLDQEEIQEDVQEEQVDDNLNVEDTQEVQQNTEDVQENQEQENVEQTEVEQENVEKVDLPEKPVEQEVTFENLQEEQVDKEQQPQEEPKEQDVQTKEQTFDTVDLNVVSEENPVVKKPKKHATKKTPRKSTTKTGAKKSTKAKSTAKKAEDKKPVVKKEKENKEPKKTSTKKASTSSKPKSTSAKKTTKPSAKKDKTDVKLTDVSSENKALEEVLSKLKTIVEESSTTNDEPKKTSTKKSASKTSTKTGTKKSTSKTGSKKSTKS